MDTWDGLTVNSPKTHPNEHITKTIVLYYSGSVPTEVDVKAAIDDIERLYKPIEISRTLE